jgi:uncharacterized iron-regulated protein
MRLLSLAQFSPLLSFLFLASASHAAGPAVRPTELDRQLRRLEKEIEKVRGLKFKKPVVARVIARSKDGPPGIQGYYDTRTKALYLYDDIKGNYQRGVLIHEMVHALQDQHFGLAKLHAASYSSDQELARAALVEGDANLVMIEILKKEQPHVLKMLEVPLEKARNLRNAFVYGQGTRYVQSLVKDGGWHNVNFHYRFPPRSTAQVLQPDQRITTVNLGPGKSRGAYGLIGVLAAHPATAARSVAAARGWRGDRLIEEGGATGWVVAFATAEQAAFFHKALSELPAGTKGVRDLQLRGARVVELRAPDRKALQALRDRIEGPPRLLIHSTKEKKSISLGTLTDRLMEADLVCVGETHDSEIHHRVQLLLIKALYARDERLGVGMEMFQRPYQKAIDRYMKGAIDEQTFLEDTEYRKRWGYDWGLYRPIVEFCRKNNVALGALNVAVELRKRVSEVGYEKLTAEEKKQIGDIDFQVKDHRAHWYEGLWKMHSHSSPTPAQKERSYQVMTLWDEYMADSAARFQKERDLRRLVVLAGSGHVDRWFGIPRRAARRTGGMVLTVHVAVGGDLAKLAREPVADFIIVAQ